MSDELPAAVHLPDLVEGHRRLHRELVEDLAGLPPELFFSPQGEHWSPAQHVDHLVRSVTPLARALRLPRIALGLSFGKSTGSRPLQSVVDDYLAKLEAGAGARGSYVPSNAPSESRDAGERDRLLERWLAAGEALTAALETWRDPDLDRYRLPHPLLGKLTIREMVGWSLYHGHHHRRRVGERMSQMPIAESQHGTDPL